MNQIAKTSWPQKRREMHNHHMDSTVWNTFKFRDDDVIVATYGKSGTTWTQQIVSQLIFNGAEGIEVSKLSPWVDLRIMPPEVIAGLELQTHRRFLKTHLPVDALVFSPTAKYIYIGRDGRDAAWSFYNHHINATDQFFARFNDAPGWNGPKLERGTEDVHAFYKRWFETDGEPYWSFWENIRSWWEIRDLPNVQLLHFSDMKRDLAGAVRRVAAFLDIEIDETMLPKIVEHCSFDYMKAHAETVAPMGGALWQGGAKTFVNKGTNGRWQGTLSQAEIAAYETKAKAELGPDCARWLEMGEAH